MTQLEIQPITPRCGAEVCGLDLAQPLDSETADQLRRALAQHCVLFFHDQSLTPEQHKAVAQHFGPLHVHPAYPNLVPGHPEIMEIYTDENSNYAAGEQWHSDVSCDECPPLGTILHMLEVPAVGGDTLFASMYAAYESLSPPLQRLISGLTAIHDGAPFYHGRYEESSDAKRTYPRAEHPVVRTHPVSGRQALFVNRIFTTRIVQLSPRESGAVLEMLFQHLEQPEFQCRFRWRQGSVAFWDNCCAQHHALWDYYPHVRHGRRVTIQGDRPYYRPDGN